MPSPTLGIAKNSPGSEPGDALPPPPTTAGELLLEDNTSKPQPEPPGDRQDPVNAIPASGLEEDGHITPRSPLAEPTENRDQPEHSIGTEAVADPYTINKRLFKQWFGLKKERERKTQSHPMAANYDYRVKYPKDQRYHELDDDARVWWVYLDEATNFDNDMVGELGDSLDILLVFAGLFSAILTTFVAQTSQALSQDYTQLSSSYLAEMTALLRANGNETTLLSVPVTSTAFSPATTDLWSNGLWFTSLTLSLSVALFAVLAKQWLRQYMSIITGTPVERVFIRQFRFDGLKKWHVQTIIGVLPVMLHLALILFLTGLVIFLVPLNIAMACISGAITAVVTFLYLAASCIPLFIVQCSYRTTFTDLLYYFYQVIRRAWHSWLIYPIRVYRFRHRKIRKPGDRSPRKSKPNVVFKEVERSTACNHPSGKEAMKFKSLFWLGESTTSSSAKEIIRHSLGAFTRNMSDKLSSIEAMPVLYGYRSLIRLLFEYKDQFDQTDVRDNDQLDYLEGLVRACIHRASCRLNFHHMKLDPKVPVPDISVALTFLASGVLEVPVSHEGNTVILKRDYVLPWVLERYSQSGYARESEIQLPTLVWNTLYDYFLDEVGKDVLMGTFHDYLQTYSYYIPAVAEQATQYLNEAIYIRYQK